MQRIPATDERRARIWTMQSIRLDTPSTFVFVEIICPETAVEYDGAQVFQATETSTQFRQKMAGFKCTTFGFSIVLVTLVAFNDKIIPYMFFVDPYGFVSVICDEDVDLIVRTVESARLEVQGNTGETSVKVPEVVGDRHALLEEGAIIHELPNALANNGMTRDVLKDLQILRPARYIDPFEQRPCG